MGHRASEVPSLDSQPRIHRLGEPGLPAILIAKKKSLIEEHMWPFLMCSIAQDGPHI